MFEFRDAKTSIVIFNEQAGFDIEAILAMVHQVDPIDPDLLTDAIQDQEAAREAVDHEATIQGGPITTNPPTESTELQKRLNGRLRSIISHHAAGTTSKTGHRWLFPHLNS